MSLRILLSVRTFLLNIQKKDEVLALEMKSSEQSPSERYRLKDFTSEEIDQRLSSVVRKSSRFSADISLWHRCLL